MRPSYVPYTARPAGRQGVFEALHALFQVLNLPLLFFQKQIFNPFESFCDLVIKYLDLLVQCLHILCASQGSLRNYR